MNLSHYQGVLTEALKLHSETLLAVKSLLDRVESVDTDFQEFGNRNDMERAQLEDAAAATILQVEEHGGLEEAEVLPRSFYFQGIGS